MAWASVRSRAIWARAMPGIASAGSKSQWPFLTASSCDCTSAEGASNGAADVAAFIASARARFAATMGRSYSSASATNGLYSSQRQLGAGGHLTGWPVLIFVLGALLTFALIVRKVPGAILISIVGMTVLAVIVNAVAKIPSWGLTVPKWPGRSTRGCRSRWPQESSRSTCRPPRRWSASSSSGGRAPERPGLRPQPPHFSARVRTTVMVRAVPTAPVSFSMRPLVSLAP